MADRATEPAATPALRPDVFISYSRRDEDFARATLAAALEARGMDVWIDVDDIRGGASDWRATIWAGIAASQVVVFVLTPDSLQSRVCAEELARAVELNKRIVVVLRRPVDGLALPDALARPNWIAAREQDDAQAWIGALVAAIETDEGWLDAHARLTERTTEWLAADRDASFLLRGSDLRAAEAWLDDQAGHAEQPTSDQIAYINAGRRAAARRQRLLLGGVALALAVSIALGTLAYVKGREARSEAFAARSIDATRRDPEQGLRLALKAAGLGHSALVMRALRESVGASGWTRILRPSRPRPLHDVAISPDGRLVVTADASPTANVWDVRSGRRVAALTHAGPVNDVDISRDGRLIATAASDGTARVWSAAGRMLRVLRPGARDVWSAQFDARGRRLIAGTDTGAATIWDLADRAARPVALPGGAQGPLTVVPFGPDGRRALTAGAGGTLRVWTLGARRRELRLPPQRGASGLLTVAAFSPRADRVLTGDSAGNVCLWSLRRRPAAASCHRPSPGGDAASVPGPITDAGFSRDGELYVAASADGSAVVRRSAGGPRLATLRHRGAVNAASFAPDGRILTAGEDRTARVWTARGELVRELPGHTDPVTLARFDAGGGRIVTGSDDGSARIWRSREDVTLLPGRPLPGADVAFSPDSSRLLAVDAAGAAAVWDLRRGTRRDLAGAMAPSDAGIAPCERPTGCAPWSPDGTRVAGIDGAGRPTIWDARSGRARTLPGSAAGGLAFAPDGRRLLALGVDRGARVIDGGGRPLATLRTGRSTVQSASYDAAGRRILTVTQDGEAHVSDAIRGTSLLTASAALPGAAAISPDGARVAIGTRADVLRIRGIAGGVRSAPPALRPIGAVSFDAAGDRVLAIGEDRVVRVWDADRLDEAPAGLRGHEDRVLSAEFSPDGRFVLSAARDGTARLWDPSLETTVMLLATSADGGARFSPDGRRIAIGGMRTVELRRCVLCAPFEELERRAAALLPDRS